MSTSWAPTAWCDGQLVPTSAIALPAASLGVFYGLGLFETLRSYAGRPFAVDYHIERLSASAAELGLGCGWLADRHALAHAVDSVLLANGLRDAAIRITLAAEGLSLDAPAPTLFIMARPFRGYPEEWYTHGVSIVVAPWRRCPEDIHVSHKTANYLTCLFARQWARSRGADEALLLNCFGRVCEGAVSNVFAVADDGAVLTPPLSEGLLPGVTRRIVIEILQNLGHQVRQEPMTLDELKAAREVMLTNSLMEVVPVRQIDETILPTCPGPLSRQVLSMYRSLTTG